MADDEILERPVQVRKIRPTRRSVSGYYVFRGTTSIAFESTLERDFVIQMEFDRNVDEIISQPCQMSFDGSMGQSYPYTPDFLVYYRDGSKPMLVEVKPGDEWRKNWRKWSTKWKTARRYAKERGWTFRIYDEGRIRNQTLVNIRFLERFKRTMVAEEDVLPIIETIRQAGHSSVSQLLMGFSNEDALRVKFLAWHLVATRRVDCEMAKPLTDYTSLWVTSHE